MNITDICAKKLKTLREINDYTQAYVANQLDISQNAYSLLEKGATKITLERLEELAILYKTTPQDLITEGYESVLSQSRQDQGGHNNFPPALSVLEKKMYEQTISRLESNIERLYEMIGQITSKISVSP
ncbi:MAG: XRE family transcriptional regulator [Sphingobacteriales bacterium]|nr:MAG: XRE family transcriptional regulator [Sphingobacteriales bacterium]